MLNGFLQNCSISIPQQVVHNVTLEGCADTCLGVESCRAFRYPDCALFATSMPGNDSTCYARRFMSPSRETAITMRVRENEMRWYIRRVPFLGEMCVYVYDTFVLTDKLRRDTLQAYASFPAAYASAAFTFDKWKSSGPAEYDELALNRIRRFWNVGTTRIDVRTVRRFATHLCATPYDDKLSFEYCPSVVQDVASARSYVQEHCPIESEIVVDTIHDPNVVLVHVGGTYVDNGWEIDVSARNVDGDLCTYPLSGYGRVHCGFLDLAMRGAFVLMSDGFLDHLHKPVEFVGVSQGTGVIPILLPLLAHFAPHMRVSRIHLWVPTPMGDRAFVDTFVDTYGDVTYSYAHGNDFISALTVGIFGIENVDTAHTTVDYDIAHCTGQWSECMSECTSSTTPRCANLIFLANTFYPHIKWFGEAFSQNEQLEITLSVDVTDRYAVMRALPLRYDRMCLADLMARFRYKDMCAGQDDAYNPFRALANYESDEMELWCRRGNDTAPLCC